jgi:hypothetical protein
MAARGRICAGGLVLALAVLLGGCASSPKTILLPMTPKLLEEVGEENIFQLSFFLSKKIRLERQERYQDRIVFTNGTFTRVEKDVAEVIDFDGTIPGDAVVSMSTMESNILYWLLGIQFEEGKDYMLGFAADMANPDGLFQVLVDDEEQGFLQYGDDVYRIVYSGTDRPYLMVKMLVGVEPEDFSHEATGRVRE